MDTLQWPSPLNKPSLQLHSCQVKRRSIDNFPYTRSCQPRHDKWTSPGDWEGQVVFVLVAAKRSAKTQCSDWKPNFEVRGGIDQVGVLATSYCYYWSFGKDARFVLEAKLGNSSVQMFQVSWQDWTARVSVWGFCSGSFKDLSPWRAQPWSTYGSHQQCLCSLTGIKPSDKIRERNLATLEIVKLL